MRRHVANGMKTVLFITCLFPPTNCVGVRRVAGFVKYLPQFGWLPIVLTVADPRGPYDQNLLKQIPEGTQIFRTGSIIPRSSTFDASRYPEVKSINLEAAMLYLYRELKSVFVTDMLIGWIRPAIQKGIEVAREERIDLIFVSAPPFSACVSAYALKKALNTPLVVDFRDSWAVGYAQQRRSTHRSKVGDRLFERQIVGSSDRVITVGDTIRDMLQERYPLLRRKFLTITNGFDPDYVSKLADRDVTNEKFSIAYTGCFPDVQTAKYFLSAVEELTSEKQFLKDKLRISFIGHMKPKERQMLEREPLKHIAAFTPFVPHEEAIEAMHRSDVLLLVVYTGPGVLTGKIFEYIGVGRPILALVPTNGEAAQLIRENNLGVVVPPKDIDGIKEALYDLYLQWEARSIKTSNEPEVLKRFDRSNLTKHLGLVFDEVCEEYNRYI